MSYNKSEMVAKFHAIVEKYVGPRRIDGVKKLLNHLENSSDFFTAPASSKKMFHLCCYGGLAMHTYNFILCMLDEVESLFGDRKIEGLFWGNTPDKSMAHIETLRESAVIVGLCHDLNKSKIWGKCYYVPNFLKGGKQSDAEPYRVTADRVALGSMQQILLAHEFIDLKGDEAQAIRYAEGLYDSSYRQDIGNKEELLTYLAHFADMKASQIVEYVNPWTRDHTTFREHLAKQNNEGSSDPRDGLMSGSMPLPTMDPILETTLVDPNLKG